MLDSIYVGMTGLLGYSKGLQVIANNTANLNTPGFKSSSLQFADLFYSNGNTNGGLTGQSNTEFGFGLNTTGTTLSFKQGELRQTSNDLDMAVDGQGLFVLKDDSGAISYTRAGQFQFNADGVFVNKADGSKVMGLDANGNLTEISIAGQKTNAGHVTSTIKFSGNLSNTAADQTVSGIQVMDATGGAHSLDVKLTSTATTTAGSWTVDLLEGTAVVGTGQIIFESGTPQAGKANVSVTYTPTGQVAIPLTLDFTGVTSYGTGSESPLAVASQDGYTSGAMTKATFDTAGALVLIYSNSQTVKSTRLALGRFDTLAAVASKGDNQFTALNSQAWHTGMAGDGAFGSVKAGFVEISNVNLSQEFSDLVILQRGYQASSQIITTANDMLQLLFAMKK